MTKMAAMPILGKNPSKIFFSATVKKWLCGPSAFHVKYDKNFNFGGYFWQKNVNFGLDPHISDANTISCIDRSYINVPMADDLEDSFSHNCSFSGQDAMSQTSSDFTEFEFSSKGLHICNLNV